MSEPFLRCRGNERCGSCGACIDHDGCADNANPLADGDCTACGACGSCIADCAEVRKLATHCKHSAPAVVSNASSVPVRLICTCGEEWRVVPIDALVTLNPVVYASSISGPMSGLVTPPRCRQGHLLSVCECWRNNRTEERG